jgi:hypothetical protein
MGGTTIVRSNILLVSLSRQQMSKVLVVVLSCRRVRVFETCITEIMCLTSQNRHRQSCQAIMIVDKASIIDSLVAVGSVLVAACI